MQFVWVYVDDFMGKGLEWYVIVELLVYASANLVPLAMPLGILLASIMTMGSMAENYELVALKSAGLSLVRIMRPMIITVLLLSAGTYAFTNLVSPQANLKFKSLLWDITEKKPALELKDNIFFNGIEGYSIRVKRKDKETQMLEDVLIYEHSKNARGNYKVIRAEKGIMEKSANGNDLVLILYNGYSYDEQEKRTAVKSDLPHIKTNFEKQEVALNVDGMGFERTNEDLFKNSYDMLNVKQLYMVEDSLQKRIENKNEDYRDYFVRVLMALDTNKSVSYINESQELGKSQMTNAIYLAENLVRNSKGFTERLAEDVLARSRHRNKFSVARHKKSVFSMACILLFFIGAPLGAIIKKGGLGMPVVFSVVFFLVFHVLFMTGEKTSVSGVLPPYIGMWLNALVLAPISMFLTYKANADSALFDATWYRRNYEQLMLRIRKK